MRRAALTLAVLAAADLTLAEGAIAPWAQGTQLAQYFQRTMAALGDDLGFDMETPWRALPSRARTALLEGNNHKVHVRYRNRFGRERSYSTGFEGVIPFIKRRHAETESDWSREKYEGYMREIPCPTCRGTRLKPESLAVLVGGSLGTGDAPPSAKPTDDGASPPVRSPASRRCCSPRRMSRSAARWAPSSTTGWVRRCRPRGTSLVRARSRVSSTRR